jgi:hypothetical protein
VKRLTKQARRSTPMQLQPALSEMDINVSSNTIRSSWKRTGIDKHKAKKKPLLTARHRQLRCQWARRYKDWDFRRGIYCDEAPIDREGSGDIWISREHHEANVSEALLPNLIQGGGMIMVWGAVWHGGRSQLVRFDCSESTGKRGGVTAVIY